MTIDQNIMDRAQKIQAELQTITEATWNARTDKKNLQYQDCMNVAIFTKLAELQLKIEDLEYKNANI